MRYVLSVRNPKMIEIIGFCIRMQSVIFSWHKLVVYTHLQVSLVAYE